VDIVVLGAAAEAEEAPLTLARLFAPLVKQP